MDSVGYVCTCAYVFIQRDIYLFIDDKNNNQRRDHEFERGMWKELEVFACIEVWSVIWIVMLNAGLRDEGTLTHIK